MSTAFNMALGTGVILGFGALALDLGYANFARTQVQAAADAAAISGAISLAQGDDGDMVDSARNWGEANTVGTLAVVVDPNEVLRGDYDRDNGTFTSSVDGLDVWVRAHTEGSTSFLSRLWGNEDLNSQAVAIARVLPGATCTFIGLGATQFNGSSTDVYGYDSTIDLDPENSPEDSGAVCSNGTLDLGAGPMIDGSARPGIGEEIDGDSSDVTGSTAALPSELVFDPPDVPGGAIAMPNTVVNNQGNVQGNKTIAPGTYKLTKDFGFQGQATLTISPPGAVNIYSDGYNVEITGGGIVNTGEDPHQLAIYVKGTPSKPIKIAGNASFYGFVYAPQAEVDVNGTSAFYGAIVSDELTFNGGGNQPLYMDISLMDDVIPGGIQLVR
jgi:hypothetical protein